VQKKLRSVYLDHAATTPVRPEVLEAMLPWFSDKFGNPSSVHTPGQEARAAVEKARAQVAALFGVRPMEVIFTSGGTEADNLAVKGIAWSRREKGNHIITSSIEHHAVLDSVRYLGNEGFSTTILSANCHGQVFPADLKNALTPHTTLVSIMHANNEIGTIQPIAELAAITHQAGAVFHTDAVQTAGHLPLDLCSLEVDMVSLSGHKLYGPKGVGALILRKHIFPVPLFHGGGHERRLRSGTENVPGIVGLGTAAELAAKEMAEESARLTTLRDYFAAALVERIEGVRLNGHPSQRLPNNVNISVNHIEGEAMLAMLDAAGISASSGSACAAAAGEPSYVLKAIGLDEVSAHGSLRFSLGRSTSRNDIDYVLEVLPGIVAKLRAMSPLACRP
jgi:cysteine desulfurase